MQHSSGNISLLVGSDCGPDALIDTRDNLNSKGIQKQLKSTKAKRSFTAWIVNIHKISVYFLL